MSRYVVSGPWGNEDAIGAFDIQSADITDTKNGQTYRDGAYRVVVSATGKPAKVGKGGTVPFYGEMAWADAARLANDLYWAAR